MKIIVLAVTLALSGCGATQLAHSPKQLDLQRAVQIVEQVLLEQPPKLRPDNVQITDDYIEFSNGYVSKSKGFGIPIPIGYGLVATTQSGSQRSRQLLTRYYFESIEAVRVSKRRKWYIIQFQKDGAWQNGFYSLNQAKSHEFIDAVETLKARRTTQRSDS